MTVHVHKDWMLQIGTSVCRRWYMQMLASLSVRHSEWPTNMALASSAGAFSRSLQSLMYT